MSWLRVDDQMILNPKVGELTDEEFRSLIAVWCYCARRKNNGRFKANEVQHMIKASPMGGANVLQSHIEAMIKAGLIVKRGGKAELYEIKDWAHFQPKDPTAAERQRAYRARNAARNGERDENVTRARGIPSRPVLTTSPPTPPQAGGKSLTRKELRRYTGCRYVYNGRAPTYVRDPLGTDKKPDYWAFPPPTREEILAALAEREQAHA